MTVESTINRNSYTGNGSTEIYNYTFRIFLESDLRVIVREVATDEETVLTHLTDYTVTGEEELAGGTIILVDSGQDWLDAQGDLDSGWVIVIRRVLPITQITDIRNGGDFYPEIHEDQFDKQTMIEQQQQDDLDRSVKLAESVDPADFNADLPASFVGAVNMVIMTNDAGDGFEPGPTADQISSAQSYAIASDTSADESAASAVLASEWATKTSAAVAGGEYSSKEYAIGTQRRGLANGGSGKDWANYTAGTVDNTEYSAKKYAQDAASSASSAAAQLASAFFRDVVFKAFADSPVTITSADNGKLFSFDTSGGAIAVTLPQISTLTPPFNVAALLAVAGNDLTFTRAGTDTIGSGTTKVMSVANTGFQLAADTDTAPDRWTVLEFGSVGDLTVTTGKIAALAVTTAKLDSLAVTDAKIAALAVTEAKLATALLNKLTKVSVTAVLAAQTIVNGTSQALVSTDLVESHASSFAVATSIFTCPTDHGGTYDFNVRVITANVAWTEFTHSVSVESYKNGVLYKRTSHVLNGSFTTNLLPPAFIDSVELVPTDTLQFKTVIQRGANTDLSYNATWSTLTIRKRIGL